MYKDILIHVRNLMPEFIKRIWHDFYFHWQLKDKTAYIVIAAFILFLAFIPLGTYQLLEYKNTQRDIRCLALNIFHEARSESLKGQRAVASVTLNRVASKRYPNSICEVVYEKRWDRIRRRYVGAFSWTELTLPPKLKSKSWKIAWRIAEKAHIERNVRKLKGAIFYHAKYIMPSWARKKRPLAKIGQHIFYK